jgi:hypothetical protein
VPTQLTPKQKYLAITEFKSGKAHGFIRGMKAICVAFNLKHCYNSYKEVFYGF